MANINWKEILRNISKEAWVEVFIRIGLFALFHLTERIPPFNRIIKKEEEWLYKFPTKGSVPINNFYSHYFTFFISYLFSPGILMISVLATILIFYGINKKVKPAWGAIVVLTFALPLTGILTNIIKVTVGRPRPDYFSRCYGKDYLKNSDSTKPCINGINDEFTLDGRRSFPSGHSSMSFCLMGFLSMHSAAQLDTWNPKNRYQSWRLIIPIIPMLIATMVAISRTSEYRHHYGDVIAGAFLGFAVVYLTYKFISPNSEPEQTESLFDVHTEKRTKPKDKSLTLMALG